MKAKGHIPASPAELSPGWVTEAMRLSGTLPPTVEVTGLEVAALDTGGVGLSGETVRVRLVYSGPSEDRTGLPETVIAKFPTTVAANRGMIESYDAYAREISFYRDIATQVPSRLPRHHGSAFDPASMTKVNDAAARLVDRLPARVHLAITKDITRFMRPTNRRYALLIEDLGSSLTVHDLVEPPPRSRLESALTSLASVHAAFWGRDELAFHPSTRPLVSTLPTVFVNVTRGRCLALAEQRWGAWLTDEDRAIFERAAEGFAADVGVVNTPMTLVHGDPRSDNVLFGGPEPIFVDWAMPGFAHPGFDVGYMLSSSLRVEDAGEAPAIIDRYLDTMADLGVDLAADVLAAGVAATIRALTILQLNSLAVLVGDYGAHGSPADLWTPRLLALARSGLA